MRNLKKIITSIIKEVLNESKKTITIDGYDFEINDDYINVGDWYYETDNNRVLKCKSESQRDTINDSDAFHVKKIVSKMKLDFADYSEALQWIKIRAKNYKSINEFYASDEYKSIYPLIRKMYDIEQSDFARKGMIELSKAGLEIGDSVVYDFVSPYFNVETYSGKIFEKSGVPYVQLDSGQTTMSGKKSVRWHKGFVRNKN